MNMDQTETLAFTSPECKREILLRSNYNSKIKLTVYTCIHLHTVHIYIYHVPYGFPSSTVAQHF